MIGKKILITITLGIIIMNNFTTIFSLSFGPYELLRSDKSLLKLLRQTCESSADCNSNERCLRILMNGNASRTGCFRMRSVQESCSLNIECSLRNRLTKCEHGSCKCKLLTEFDEVTNDCYSATTCNFDSDCAPGKRCSGFLCSDTKDTCLDPSMCHDYEYCTNTRCHSPKQVGEICTKNHECKRWDVNSYCHSNEDRFSISRYPMKRKHSTCVCKPRYLVDLPTGKCILNPKPKQKDCIDRNGCPPEFSCKDGLCFRPTSAFDRIVIEKSSTTSTPSSPHKVPLFRTASHETRYYVLIAGVLFMAISLIAGIAGCIRRSREINQATYIRTQVRPSVGMRNGGVNGMFNDSNLTPRAHQARRVRLIDRSAPLTTLPDDSPPDYFSVVQSPPSFDDIFGSREKKQPIDQHS